MVRIEALTFFRFIAASIVVIFHYGRNDAGFSGILIAGPEMVTFFFVLSGFVMGIVYLNKDFSNESYWWARASRIVPIYLLALLLTLWANNAVGIKFNYMAVLLHLTLLQAWFPEFAVTLNFPAWALSAEAFFYLIFPFLIFTIKKYKLSATAMITIALSLWLLTQIILATALAVRSRDSFPIPDGLIYYWPLAHLCSFIMGIAGAKLILTNQYMIKNDLISLLVVGLAILLVVMVVDNQHIIVTFLGLRLAYRSSLLAPLFLIFILALSICRSNLTSLLSAKPLVFLGEASYSVYIFQHPIHMLFNKYIARSLNLNAGWRFIVFFALLIIISVCCFLFFEKPVNKFLRKLGPI